jgi:riboflavin transporter FmnP
MLKILTTNRISRLQWNRTHQSCAHTQRKQLFKCQVPANIILYTSNAEFDCGFKMNTKVVAVVAIFAALMIVLTPLMIPFPPISTLGFGIMEIPLMVIFLLFGFKFAVPVLIIDCLFLFTVWPGPSAPFLPIGALVAELSMMLGFYVVFKIVNRKVVEAVRDAGTRKVAYAIVSAVLFRVVLTMPLMYGILKLPMFSIPDMFILTVVLPWLAFFNTVQGFITLVPSFVISKIVDKSLRAGIE